MSWLREVGSERSTVKNLMDSRRDRHPGRFRIVVRDGRRGVWFLHIPGSAPESGFLAVPRWNDGINHANTSWETIKDDAFVKVSEWLISSFLRKQESTNITYGPQPAPG